MKITSYRLRTLLGFAAIGGFSMLPIAVNAQDAPPAPPAEAGAEKPDFSKIRGMVREMMELRRAGKHDEAGKVAEKIKAATNNHPRVVEMLERQGKGHGPEFRDHKSKESGENPKARDKDKDKEEHREGMKPKEGMKPQEPKGGKMEAKNPENRDIKPVERIRHLREAAGHLEAAGVEGMAKSLRAQIAEMEKRMKLAGSSEENRGDRIRRSGGPEQMRRMQFGMRPDGGAEQMRPMQFGMRPDGGMRPGGGVQQMRPMQFGMRPDGGMRPGGPPMGPGPRFGGDVQQGRGFQAPEAQAKPPVDPNAALMGEIRKLRAEMGELRGEVKRMQAGDAAAPKHPHTPGPQQDRPE